MQGFDPAPAYAITARFDVLAHDKPARLLSGDLNQGLPGPRTCCTSASPSPSGHLVLDFQRDVGPAGVLSQFS